MKASENIPTRVLVGNRRFRLVRYFALTSLVMFVLVALALTHFLRQQGNTLQSMRAQQVEFFGQVQQAFAKQQDEAARRDLMSINEAGNVNLTRLFTNTLWERDFASFVARAEQIPVDHCRSIADVVDPKDGKAKPPDEKKACFAEVGAKIMALPGFRDLNTKVYASMKKSTVFKVKVFDLRGITVYSSEHAQIGDDYSFKSGWKSALAGKPASELVHRDKFRTFEGVVENRSLIGSYLPVLNPADERIVGVLEVYSDVTPALDQIKATSEAIAQSAAANQAAAASTAAANEARISEIGTYNALIIGSLLLLLFGALFLIVRRADRLIAQQEQEREQAQQHLAQAEKMASLGQMVAGVAHQLNTPIAFSHNNVSMAIEAIRGYQFPLAVAGKFSKILSAADRDLVMMDVARARRHITRISDSDLDIVTPTEMLSDTLQGLDQMRELVENLRNFTRLDRSKTARTDLNSALRTVVYIAKSVIPTHIQVREDYAPLPEIECNVSQLNQVFLNLINNAAQAITGAEGTITITTRSEDGRIRIDVSDTGSGIPDDVLPQIWDTYFTTKSEGEGTGLGLPIAKTIVEEHGGEITVRTKFGEGTTFSVRLPAMAEEPVAA